MAPLLKKKILEAIKDMGIDMTSKTMQSNGPSFFVQFTMNGVDELKLIKAGKGEEGATHFKKLLNAMTFFGNDNII